MDYLWAFYFVPLIYISIFVPLTYCLDECGFVVEPEVRKPGIKQLWGPWRGKDTDGQFCGAEERTLGLEKTHQSLDMDNEESVRFFPKPRGPRWGIRQGEGMGGPAIRAWPLSDLGGAAVFSLQGLRGL